MSVNFASGMSLDEYIKANTIEYRGYDIMHGSVSQNGHCLLMSYCPLDPSQSELDMLLADAKKWVDEQIDKQPEGETV